MTEIKIKSETSAKRCEICHLEDQFDPERNVCKRCINVIVPEDTETISLNSKYNGIWGWVSIFWISSTFLNPLGGAWEIISDYRTYNTYFDTYPSVFTWFIVTNILNIGIVSLSVYVGIGLITIRPNIITWVKRYLIVSMLTIFLMDFITIFTFTKIVEATQMRNWIDTIL